MSRTKIITVLFISLQRTDEETKEFLRMRDDHKLALKKVKQQILAFCLRHNYRYDGKRPLNDTHQMA